MFGKSGMKFEISAKRQLGPLHCETSQQAPSSPFRGCAFHPMDQPWTPPCGSRTNSAIVIQCNQPEGAQLRPPAHPHPNGAERSLKKDLLEPQQDRLYMYWDFQEWEGPIKNMFS